MSKPKIYATCNAGCLWETVHMSDFLASGGLVTLAETGNLINLIDPLINFKNENPLYDCNQRYRITDGTIADNTDGWNISIILAAEVDGVGINPAIITLPTRNKWDHDIDFILKSIIIGEGNVKAVYSINGTAGTATISLNKSVSSIDTLTVYLSVINNGAENDIEGHDKTAVYRLATGEGLVIDSIPPEDISEAVAAYLAEHPVSGVTQEQIEDAVSAYLEENPIEGGTGTVTDEQIAAAVADYLEENPIEGGTGTDGKSAYEIACDNGFEGSETEWLESLNGADAYTPVKGVDYFTEEDKAELKAEIIEEVSQDESFEIVSSVEEMTDPTKKYVNSQTGTIWECTERTETVPGGTVANFTNVFNPDTATVGSRWSSSSKAPTTSAGAPCILSDFIPCDLSSGEHTIRIKNGQLHGTSSNAGIAYFSSNTADSQIFLVNNLGATPTEEADGVLAYKLGEQNGSMISNYANTRYIRCVAVQYNGTSLVTPQTAANAENIIITIDEPITYTTTEETTETYYDWTDTGEIYTSTSNIETAILRNAEDIAELKAKQSGAVWYAIGDSIISGYLIGGPSKTWVAHVLKYNGYDLEKSKNLGVAGIGFVREDPTNGNVIQDIVDNNDFSAVDLVTVAVGINDWQNDCSIDDVKTAMTSCFNKILSDNPYCKIFFITPFNKNRGSKETNWALGYEQNGITLENFVAGQISACRDYGIEVIDMTHSSVINRENLTSVLYDNTHPNETCHIALGKELARKITFA